MDGDRKVIVDAVDASALDRKPWHAPTVELVPVNTAKAAVAPTSDGSTSS
jgi:hypothetical protein